MEFLQDLSYLVRRIAFFVVGVIFLGGVLFSTGIQVVLVGPISFALPSHESSSIPSLVFKKISGDLVPTNINLVAPSPLAAFSTELSIALFIAFIMLFPLGLLWLIRYVTPALYGHERRVLGLVVLPSFALFLIGMTFGYRVVVPSMLYFLSLHAQALGVPQYFFLGDFISLVTVFLFLCGTIFLLPVFMPLLTRFGILSSSFYRRHWREFVMIALVFSAIFATDGTGVSMVLLAIPIITCYVIGMGISRYVE